MLRDSGHPSLHAALVRAIAEAREAGLDGRDLTQALCVRFPEVPLREVMAAWSETDPSNPPASPGDVLRAIRGPETLPPAIFDHADPRIPILQKVELGLTLALSPETSRAGQICQVQAALEALVLLGAPPDSLAPLQVLHAVVCGENVAWLARGFLVLAFRCLRALKVPENQAAKDALALLDCPDWLGGYTDPVQTLQDWHKNLSRDQRVPRDGEHKTILDEGIRQLAVLRRLPGAPERIPQLRQAAARFASQARILVNSLPPKAPKKGK